MTVQEAIKARHSVRKYTGRAIEKEKITELEEEIRACNTEGNLHIQLVANESDAFRSIMAGFGGFTGVTSYIALVGKDCESLPESIGYYGERIAIRAQQLGLNTCWVALTFSKKTVYKNISISSEEKLVCVLTLGYGETQGKSRKTKPLERLCMYSGTMPDWFRSGMESAMLAPSAMNQQHFLFTLDGDRVTLKSTGGMYSDIDKGIVKYHFEKGSGHDVS